MTRGRKILLAVGGISLVGFILIQFLPVGRVISVLEREENPPVVVEVQWDSPETERLARAACYDCHSNETVWPWYAQIAPLSWYITRDVNRGRAAMNFSEETAVDMNTNDIEYHIYNDMPPRFYKPFHPESNLTDEQKAALVAGMRATFGEGGAPGMGGMDMGGAPDPAATPEAP